MYLTIYWRVLKKKNLIVQKIMREGEKNPQLILPVTEKISIVVLFIHHFCNILYILQHFKLVILCMLCYSNLLYFLCKLTSAMVPQRPSLPCRSKVIQDTPADMLEKFLLHWIQSELGKIFDVLHIVKIIQD